MGRYAQAQKRGRDLALGSGPARPVAPQGEDMKYETGGEIDVTCLSRIAGLAYFQARAAEDGVSDWTYGSVAPIVGGTSVISLELDPGENGVANARWGPTATPDLQWSQFGGNTVIVGS
jgi:hypothetical protein